MIKRKLYSISKLDYNKSKIAQKRKKDKQTKLDEIYTIIKIIHISEYYQYSNYKSVDKVLLLVDGLIIINIIIEYVL